MPNFAATKLTCHTILCSGICMITSNYKSKYVLFLVLCFEHVYKGTAAEWWHIKDVYIITDYVLKVIMVSSFSEEQFNIRAEPYTYMLDFSI